MTIQTARLVMRPYQDEDFEFLCSLFSDPEVVRFVGNGQTRSKDGAMEFLYWVYRSYKTNPKLGLRVLVRKDDGKLIGHAGLVPQTVNGFEELEIGYWIAREHWGQGYATEAASALKEYGSRQLGRKRFVSLIQPANTASRKVAERIGMELEKEIVLAGRTIYVYSNAKGK
ncbi:RimJ/RimL family protein N-acetyltransferase [Planomicrobium soli]|uniref:RimJ/RimL family protein N-acetyltransferase n=1 Tax=Planomicrobium soli TaxID=1176648 RepID=A0A2P8H1Q9_9BACL|nr:GNAT family N-acetyltransferase [Planomicrobium soli]PSL40147.1 RimJ/RimL family protein N-acetyltransferase [Planomicrobium soli]